MADVVAAGLMGGCQSLAYAVGVPKSHLLRHPVDGTCISPCTQQPWPL